MNSLKNNELAFGFVIKKKRLSKRMTQEELSDLSGVSRSYISKLEKGLTDPGLYNMLKIASALNIKISHLIEEVEHLS